jgi:hypothetical protein
MSVLFPADIARTRIAVLLPSGGLSPARGRGRGFGRKSTVNLRWLRPYIFNMTGEVLCGSQRTG